MIAAPAPTGPPWVQILLSALGLLGGTGGITAIVTVLLQRRKFQADTADVLTDTALTLVEPLKMRVRELESEASNSRQQAVAMHRELAELRDAVQEMTAMMRRWRAAILAPDATIERLRDLIHHG
ncbi:hypothetical protein AB0J86_35205 [Micromonospora sp. NPDC049559]|uniref:hypothetical protein n=1 Tax=Micromonospora sp. NPDC049559 TaxID=3155923 RepID=UPI0034420614